MMALWHIYLLFLIHGSKFFYLKFTSFKDFTPLKLMELLDCGLFLRLPRDYGRVSMTILKIHIIEMLYIFKEIIIMLPLESTEDNKKQIRTLVEEQVNALKCSHSSPAPYL